MPVGADPEPVRADPESIGRRGHPVGRSRRPAARARWPAAPSPPPAIGRLDAVARPADRATAGAQLKATCRTLSLLLFGVLSLSPLVVVSQRPPSGLGSTVRRRPNWPVKKAFGV